MSRRASDRFVYLLNHFLESQQACCEAKGRCGLVVAVFLHVWCHGEREAKPSSRVVNYRYDILVCRYNVTMWSVICAVFICGVILCNRPVFISRNQFWVEWSIRQAINCLRYRKPWGPSSVPCSTRCLESWAARLALQLVGREWKGHDWILVTTRSLPSQTLVRERLRWRGGG